MEYKKRLRNGTVIRVLPFEHIQQQIFWYGYYERPVSRLLERIIQPDSNVLDIGANIGYFTLIAAKKAKGGKIFAFEPVRELFYKLQQNIQYNRLLNVEAVQLALGEVEKDATVYLAAADNRGMSSLHRPENFSGIRQPIKVVTVDGWLKHHDIGSIDVVKIDVEGSEPFVLRGMRHVLAKFKPLLVIEICASTLSYFGMLPSDITSYLKKFGYEPFKILKDGLIKADSSLVTNENIAFVHRDKFDEYRACIAERPGKKIMIRRDGPTPPVSV